MFMGRVPPIARSASSCVFGGIKSLWECGSSPLRSRCEGNPASPVHETKFEAQMEPANEKGFWLSAFSKPPTRNLEQIPQELVVDLVVVLHLGWLDDGAQQPRAAVRRRLFQIGETLLHVRAQN